MARPSKTKQFAIYEDAGIPTPDSSHQPSFDDTLEAQDQDANNDDVFKEGPTEQKDGTASEAGVLEDIEEAVETIDVEPTDTEPEDERRESAVTSTSISSLPESSSETDQESSLPMHKPYTPPMIRPSFRRPESVRRMQMTSPIPFERSPRRSGLSAQSRTGTPRSARSSVKGSPRPRRHQEEYVEPEKKEYPLVLLHVTLLPVELRWSMEVMQEVLPQKTLDSLQLLRSKVTETILQRGILIPHPREEYELLEERLLEALELRKEQITKCGHFRARDSTSSISSEEGSTNSDSGVGSSVASDEELCMTCQHHLKTARTVHGLGGSKWNIRVFAANGLMRASAWAAAWSEMERVDVEILPWIGEDLRRQLDARMEEEDVDKTMDVELAERLPEAPMPDPEMFALPSPPAILAPPQETIGTQEPTGELPQVYRAKDVPLSLLLKNYIYLLAKDKRNIAIFGLAVLAMWLSLRATLAPQTVEISPLPPVCENSGPDVLAMDTARSTGSVEPQPVPGLNASHMDIPSMEEAISEPPVPEPLPLEAEDPIEEKTPIEGPTLPTEPNATHMDTSSMEEAVYEPAGPELLPLEIEDPMMEKITPQDPESTLADSEFDGTCDNPASEARLFEIALDESNCSKALRGQGKL